MQLFTALQWVKKVNSVPDQDGYTSDYCHDTYIICWLLDLYWQFMNYTVLHAWLWSRFNVSHDIRAMITWCDVSLVKFTSATALLLAFRGVVRFNQPGSSILAIGLMIPGDSEVRLRDNGRVISLGIGRGVIVILKPRRGYSRGPS